MKITEENNTVIVDGVKDFHLDHTFDNGQCFRWNKETDGSYTGVAFGKAANINYIGESLFLDNITLEEFHKNWRDYLDLDRDYGAVKKMLSEKDSAMRNAISYGYGMRILQQEKWETLISFILSQNNNISRIKKNVEDICRAHGSPLGIYKGRMFYSFPTAATLARLSPEELDTCRLGYRAKYIIETAKQILADEGKILESLGRASTEQAYEYLLSLCGVGPKVANCIMLFSMGKQESFPLDVWIKRVMNQVYHIEEGNTKMMQAYADSHFGGYGGIAQQYLFYYTREISKNSSSSRRRESSEC